MKFNKWTLGLAAVGAVSLASAARADEKMTQVQTALSNTTLSGYVDVAASWRPGTDFNGTVPTGPNIPLYSYAQNDGFNLNAVDIALDKPLDESPWASGYHVEMMMGAQNPVGYAGLQNGLNTLRQAYIATRTPVGNSGVDWKIGMFDPIIGYESNSDPLNPNYTRSYGYTIEPVSHIGAVGTYKVSDVLSVTAGIANSWSLGVIGIEPGTAFESQKTYMGAVAITAPDAAGWLKGATVNAGIVHAVDSINAAAGTGTQDSTYIGATIPTPNNNLKLGASYDYRSLTAGGEAWAAAVYAAFQVNDKTSLNLRAEYANDDAGLLYGGGGVRNAAEAVTATLQYNLWANVISRAEFRWDHVEHGTPFGVSSTTGAAFRNNDFLVALNLIYQF
jgi:Putative beta-barrel porin-2, OmpL-like. bbp2